MKTTYYRYTLQGEHSIDEAQRKIGDALSGGLIVRIDRGGGKTHVFVARQGTEEAKSTSASSAKAEEVSEGEVTKPG